MDFSIIEWIIAITIVIFILLVVWWKFKKEIKFLTNESIAEGIIINWMASVQDGKKVFYPMIEFYTSNNERITFRAEEMCESEPMYEQGTKVKVRYLAEDPEIRKVVYPK